MNVQIWGSQSKTVFISRSELFRRNLLRVSSSRCAPRCLTHDLKGQFGVQRGKMEGDHPLIVQKFEVLAVFVIKFILNLIKV